MLLIMLSIIANEGRVDHIDFAQRIHKWMNEGFKEFGDIGTLCPNRQEFQVYNFIFQVVWESG